MLFNQVFAITDEASRFLSLRWGVLLLFLTFGCPKFLLSASM